MSKLFTPFQAGVLSLDHRVVMAPLTRLRSEPGDKAGALIRDYYTQRTSQGGLIISEATPVAREGYGYAGPKQHQWRGKATVMLALLAFMRMRKLKDGALSRMPFMQAAGKSSCNSGMLDGSLTQTFSQTVKPRSRRQPFRPRAMPIRPMELGRFRCRVPWNFKTFQL